MPLFKNFLGSGNMAKFRSLFFGEDTQNSPNTLKESIPTENVKIGLKYKRGSKNPKIGKNALIRSNSIVYNDVEIGDNFKTGHGVIIREKTTIGNDVLVGTNTVIEGHSIIGNNVSIQSNVYIPTNSIIEDYVFIGPCACFTNDKYPIRVDFDLKGPVIKRGASIGANSTFLSNIEIGEGAMIAAGAIVTMDVPDYFLAIGAPARIKPLPKHLKKLNKIK
jgi:acetyltransferase-like isoleucine patch superfamily enzyme